MIQMIQIGQNPQPSGRVSWHMLSKCEKVTTHVQNRQPEHDCKRRLLIKARMLLHAALAWPKADQGEGMPTNSEQKAWTKTSEPRAKLDLGERAVLATRSMLRECRSIFSNHARTTILSETVPHSTSLCASWVSACKVVLVVRPLDEEGLGPPAPFGTNSGELSCTLGGPAGETRRALTAMEKRSKETLLHKKIHGQGNEPNLERTKPP